MRGKRIRRSFAWLLVTVLVLSLIPAAYAVAEQGPGAVAEVAVSESARAFKVVTRVEEYGAVVPAVIIDMGETITAGGFDAESFAVTMNRLTNATTVNPTPVSRTVTKAYVNDKQEIDPAGAGTASGRYIVLEMPYSSSDNADYSAVMQYLGGHNIVRPLEMYTVRQTAAIANGEAVIPADTLYENAGRINLIVDDFSRETTADGLNYRLFTPEKEAGKTYPLIVWLHGAGEGHRPTEYGVGNEEQLLGNEGATAWAEPARQAQNPAYVAAPQSPTSWVRTDAAGIKTMIDEILAADPAVDPARIYVTGCSMGGMMTMSMITAYPDLFAAAIPICAATTVARPAFTTEDYAKLVDLPMWLFHAQNDTTVRIGQSSDLIWATMQELGKEPGEGFKYTIFPTVAPYMEHWSWVPVANDSYNGETIGVVDWLFAQAKKPAAYPFKVVTRVEEYGAVVPAVIIDMGETVTAGGFDAESFAVTMNRLTNATTVNPTPADRTVTKAYVNDKAEIDPAGAGAASGRYIVLELQYGYNDVNYSYVMQYLGGSNIVRPLEMYTVRQTAAIGNGEAVIPADTLYENAGRINLLVDDFSRETTADGLNYRLFTPEKEAGKTYPLIVWLHGGGEGHSPTSLGVGNEEQLFGNEGATAWAEPARQAQNPAYVAAPQAAPRWSRASTPQIRAMIGEILAANPDVDPARIYVTGCSMGGMMTMLMITAYPDLFAAAMPICPASPSPALTTEEYANLADLPMWLFHAQNDTTVRIGQSSDLIWATLQELGKEPSESFKYRIFPTVEYNQHWSWVPVANDSYNGETIGVVDWLFAQAKKSAAYPFKVVTRVEEYGAVVPAVIIDMGETVTAGGFDAESFAVTLHRLDINFMTGGVSVNPEPVSRTVTKAYVNNAEQIDPAGVGTPSGRYIVLEMPYSSSDNADYSAVMQYAMNFANFVASHNVVRPLEMYAVHQTAAITNGEAVIPANTLYENAGRINLIVDDFSRETTADGLNYRLFTPEKEAGKTYPLIVWLHGAGEGHSPTDFGVGNEEQLLGNEGATAWAEPARQAQNPAYVAAPQAVTVWERTDAAKIKTMIDDILAANPDVDLARIYVMGCSMGGMMTMSMITAYPNLFAAAIPICAATMVANPAFTTEDYAKLVDLPMWLFHAQDDGTVVIGQSSDLIWATMQELGKEPGESFKYRIFPTVAPYMEHWSWVPVANDSYNGETIGVVDWLFAQVKTGDFTVTADKAAKTVTVTGRNYVSGRKLPLFAEYRTPSADADGEYETTVTADEDGRFSVTLPAALTTDKPWLGGHKYVVTVDDVVHTAPIYTTELRAHSSARVSLRIKGRAPLNLRTDADPTFYEVTVSNPAIASVTQVNGVWTVTGLRAGTVLVMVRATDGSDLTHAVTVSVA